MNAKKIYPFSFWAIPLALYTLFFIVPGILGLFYSFTSWTIYSSSRTFVGLQNYRNLLSDSRFTMGFRNTLQFAFVTTVFKTAFGLALAVALNARIRTRNALRTVFFLPIVLSTLIVGLIFKSVLLPNSGLLDAVLAVFDTRFLGIDWLGNPKYAMGTIDVVEIWRGSGYCMVIFLAGLQAISNDYYEAASIDGVGAWKRFTGITLPLLVPAISVNVLLSVVNGLKVFDIVIALTGGGPGLSTEVLSTGIYAYMGNGALSTGSAANIALTFFVVIIFAIISSVFSKLEADL